MDDSITHDLSQKSGKWTSEEDDRLRQAVLELGDKSWKQISERIVLRTPIQCLHRWTNILKPGRARGPWSTAEDQQVESWVKLHGPRRWSICALGIPGRSGKQCRERWSYALNPALKKGEWSADEDTLIFKLYGLKGAKWTEISKSLPGRSENCIKNRFYSTIRKSRNTKDCILLPSPHCSRPLVSFQVQQLLQQLEHMEDMLKHANKSINLLENSIEEEEELEKLRFSDEFANYFTERFNEPL